ncbi:unnamed protein product [Ilex paraguariensis]|uniref:SAP domain-containing protein n=1 Tax=Ilex paraguariensis TaxID=185542 RepID=A0ABC8SVI1_9AQUA
MLIFLRFLFNIVHYFTETDNVICAVFGQIDLVVLGSVASGTLSNSGDGLMDEDKLTYFRIKELKDVLTQLGLSKQGKKQDLVDRILAILVDERVSGMWAKKNAVSREEVAKLVDDTFRKMQVAGATDLASKGPDLSSKGPGVSENSNLKSKEEIEDSYQMYKIQCPCGSSLQTDSMIKCEDPKCNVWQHIGCVMIPEKPVDGVPPVPPDIYYCELCRLSRADP